MIMDTFVIATIINGAKIRNLWIYGNLSFEKIASFHPSYIIKEHIKNMKKKNQDKKTRIFATSNFITLLI